MTIQADSHYVEQYKSRVTHVYQNKGFLLKGMLMPEGRLEGKKAYWPVHGSTIARKKQRHVAAQEGNITKSFVNADLVTWETFDFIGKFDMSRQTVNEKEALYTAGAMALGRGVDQEVMDMFNIKAPAAGAGFKDTSAAAFSLADAMLITAEFMDRIKGGADGQIFCGVPPIVWQLMSGFKQFTSSDYIGPELPFKSRTVARTWNFVNWVLLPIDYFPVPSANRADIFMWHKPAVGWSDNVGEGNLDAYFVWDNTVGEWTLRQEAEGAAVTLLSEGLYRARVKTDIAAITLN